MSNTGPSYLLLAVWVVVAVGSVAIGDYALALIATTVILFAVANVITMRFMTQRIAAKDQEIAARQRHIDAQQRQIGILIQDLAALTPTQIRTDKKEPNL